MSTVSKAMEDPLQTAGVIILITGAGGAFGGMIRMAGVGETIEGLATSYNISLILLAWGATAVVRIAQGSATVAMITGVGLMSSVIGDGSSLPYHSLYIFLAIGFGSITLSWMNDSGFWVVQRLSGFTEKETLKTWSVMLTAISLAGINSNYDFLHPVPDETGSAGRRRNLKRRRWLVQLKGGLRRKIIRLCFLSKNHGNGPEPVFAPVIFLHEPLADELRHGLAGVFTDEVQVGIG